MDINDLKKEMGRSGIKNLLIGGLILTFGIFIALMAVDDSDAAMVM